MAKANNKSAPKPVSQSASPKGGAAVLLQALVPVKIGGVRYLPGQIVPVEPDAVAALLDSGLVEVADVAEMAPGE